MWIGMPVARAVTRLLNVASSKSAIPFARAEHIDLGEVVEEQVRRSGAAIDDQQVRGFEQCEQSVDLAWFLNVHELGVDVEAQQRRVLIVSVCGAMWQPAIFQRLHEVHGEEAFSDAAFSFEDEVQFLGHGLCVLRLKVARISDARTPAS